MRLGSRQTIDTLISEEAHLFARLLKSERERALQTARTCTNLFSENTGRIIEGKGVSPQIILYVKSIKSPRGNEQIGDYKQQAFIGGIGGTATKTYSYCNPETVVEYDYVLPEDQQRMAKDLEKVASEHGFDSRIVDLTRESSFSRWRFEHSKRIKTLPALVNDSGEIIEGVLTKEQIEAFLSQESKSAT